MPPALRVAVCIAGAFRHWPEAWELSIKPNVITPLGDGVDIFAVSEEDGKKRTAKEKSISHKMTVKEMRRIFGKRFRDGEQLTLEHLTDVSNFTWPEIAQSQRDRPTLDTTFAYVYKIWRCGQLIHRSGIVYDVVIRLRPDLTLIKPFHFTRMANGTFELEVGGRCVRFGSREVVIHALTNFCANDWLAIGSLEAMTVTMDVARFWTSASSFLSPDTLFDKRFKTSSLELILNQLWWRTGTAVKRVPLFAELARQNCHHAHCIRMPAWPVLEMKRKSKSSAKRCSVPSVESAHIGSIQLAKNGLANDCGAPSGGPLEWFSGPTPDSPTIQWPPPKRNMSLLRSRSLPKDWKLTGRSGPEGRLANLVETARVIRLPDGTPAPAWARPDCPDVRDLSMHDSLLPCKKRTSDVASYQPGAHRPEVLSGYGVPLIFPADGEVASPPTRPCKLDRTSLCV